MGANGKHVSGTWLFKGLQLTHPPPPFASRTFTSTSLPMYICPGCQQHFQPGGYANHLRFSHDLRCRSVRSSLLRTSSNSSYLPPTPGPSPAPEPSDVEMMNVNDEQNPPASHTLDPPLPDQTTLANRPDRWEDAQPGPESNPNELPTTGPHRPSRNAIVIDSDIESDAESDDDGCDRSSHRNEQTSRPSLVDNETSDQAAAVQTARTFAKPLDTYITYTDRKHKVTRVPLNLRFLVIP